MSNLHVIDDATDDFPEAQSDEEGPYAAAVDENQAQRRHEQSFSRQARPVPHRLWLILYFQTGQRDILRLPFGALRPLKPLYLEK